MEDLFGVNGSSDRMSMAVVIAALRIWCWL